MSHTILRNTSAAQNAPTTPTGKSSVSEPKLSDTERVELSDILSSGPETSQYEDVMQLARIGDIQGVKRLYSNGSFNSSYCDKEGITPLHWAAINNQYAMCEFLIGEGVDVNKKGGESVATPAMWAAQRCHYYIVNLLLENGADPFTTDIQGYNILHLATFEGNIFLLVLLLHYGIDVDIPDRQGHTCLMWAAYKGFPSCVDLFLRWGANVQASDETKFTALHWALVKGSQGCIQKLIEYGADRYAQTSTGKTPAITAQEMRTERIWHRALNECGYDDDGNQMSLIFPLSMFFVKNSRAFINRFFFIFPVLIIWIMIMIVSHMVVFVGVPLALFAGYSLQWLAQQLIVYAPSDMKKMHMTPWLAGVFAGTLSLVGLNWLTTILPDFRIRLVDDVSSSCNLLATSLCKVVNLDPYTLVLVSWALLQLTWVTMLIFVQLVQISRGVTTWENMRGTNYDRSNRASEVIISALTTGTTNSNVRHGSNLTPSHHHHHHHHNKGFLATWKRILGLDTFVETTIRRKEMRHNHNVFSAGCLVNCQDFWCDSAPIFGKRENRHALLWGKAVDYTSMYEAPPRRN
ncbi:hypothetical protein EPUL_001582 [Erysiphe pulchra]|uniref:protein S-acyltransferase n=1 Tax=Erysiphe pulchra TaxID=225359 RepID=A0A2S4PVM5_9PEZI|nr:hypothetical protein EPUL_001582 [Erysiphe pulchra]